MNPDELKSAEERLITLRAELLAEKDQASDGSAIVELDQQRVGRINRMDDMQRQEISKELDRRRDLQLKRIEGAFQRLEKGTYGDCVTCGDAIDAKRLEFDPTTFFCIACAQKAERR